MLAEQLVSYGSCQFPTLGFVVERFKAIQAFVPEVFHKIRGGAALCAGRGGRGRPGADSEGGLRLAASRPLVSTFRARGGSRVAVTGSDPAGPPRPPAVTHDHRDGVVEFSWKRHRLFSHTACLVLYQLCMEVGGLGAHPPRVRSLALAGGGGTLPSLN